MPLTDETRGLIGAEELGWMKPSAYLINVARGNLIDEAAAAAVFRSIGDELFTAYQNEPILLRGFESQTDQLEDFARFVLTGTNEKPERSRGKWLRYGGKSGLFSFVR